MPPCHHYEFLFFWERQQREAAFALPLPPSLRRESKGCFDSLQMTLARGMLFFFKMKNLKHTWKREKTAPLDTSFALHHFARRLWPASLAPGDAAPRPLGSLFSLQLRRKWLTQLHSDANFTETKNIPEPYRAEGGKKKEAWEQTHTHTHTQAG